MAVGEGGRSSGVLLYYVKGLLLMPSLDDRSLFCFLASMVIYLCTQHSYFTTDATLIMFDSNSRDEYSHASGTGSGIISVLYFPRFYGSKPCRCERER